MRFKELYEKYISQTAAPEEAALVEEELEKGQIVFAHVSEMDLPELAEGGGEISAPAFQSLRRRMKKRIFMLAALAALLLLGGVVLYQTALKPAAKPILDLIQKKEYYNPDKREYSENHTDLSYIMAAYTELFYPGYYSTYALANVVSDESFRLTLTRHSLFTGEVENIQAVFNGPFAKEKLDFPSGFTRHPYMNAFLFGEFPFDFSYDMLERAQESPEKLEKLPEFVSLQAYVSFSRDLSMEEVLDLIKNERENGVYVGWVAVRKSPAEFDYEQFMKDGTKISDGIQLYPHMGFSPLGSGMIFDEVAAYPFLSLVGQKQPATAESYARHFTAMLDFCLDNADFLALSDALVDKSVLEEARAYVEENGVASYGLYVMGKPSALLALWEREEICFMMLDGYHINP